MSEKLNSDNEQRQVDTVVNWHDVEEDGYPEKAGNYLIKIDGEEAFDAGHWSDTDYFDPFPEHGFMYDFYSKANTKITHWAEKKSN